MFQRQTKDILKNILRDILVEWNKGCTQESINQKHNKIISGTIEAGFWKAIIEKLYDQETCELVTERVLLQIKADKNKKETKYNGRQITPRNGYQSHSRSPRMRTPPKSKYYKYFKAGQSIQYESFVKVVMNFQMERHWLMIETLNRYFKYVDADLDGNINKMQLVEILEKLNITDEQQIDSIWNELDPYDLDFITYTQFLEFGFNAKIPKYDEKSGMMIYVSLVDIAEESLNIN